MSSFKPAWLNSYTLYECKISMDEFVIKCQVCMDEFVTRCKASMAEFVIECQASMNEFDLCLVMAPHEG